MKTILKKINGSSLSLNNEHLKDILSNEKYIELGSVSYKVLNNLLAGKLIKLDDLSYFDIQNIGLGKSSIENEELRNKMPFIRLGKTIKNHSSLIAIITYGIVIQRVSSMGAASHNEFTPIVLIPVNIYIEEDISFQMISLPFVNPSISLSRRNGINQSENLNSIYSIDKFCLSLGSPSEIRLESYLSFISIKGTKTKVTNNYFNETLNLSYIDTHYNLSDNRPLNITRLNKAQRIALEKAHTGQSFELIGVDGTGKTTTLTNIAINACANGKRVLYLSNSKATLNQVYSILEEKKLNGIASKLYLPFKDLVEKYQRNKTEEKESIKKRSAEIITKLNEDYKSLEKYIGSLYKRINNFYVIDVVNQCVKYRDLKTSFPVEALDGISTIYHEELDGVINALKLVDKNINKIESIKESIFASIPRTVKTEVDEIINLLSNLSGFYKELEIWKNKLNNIYGIIDAENYAYLRKNITNYHALDTSLVPNVWLKHNEDGLYEFENAKKAFKQFESEMNERLETENDLASQYNMDYILKLDLDKDVPFILSKFESVKEYNDLSEDERNQTIDKFLKENDKLLETLEAYSKTIVNGESYFTKMNTLLKCKVDYSNDSVVEKMINFMMFINKNVFSKLWLQSNRNSLREELIDVKEKLDQYEKAKAELNVADAKHLADMIDSMKIKRGFKFGEKRRDMIERIEKAKALLKTSKTIDKMYDRYIELAGEEYNKDANPVKIYDRFVKLYEAIGDLNVQNGLTTLLSSYKYEQLIIAIVPFINFGEYYLQTSERHRLIENYKLVGETNSYKQKIKDIKDAIQFSKNVKEVLDNVLHCYKENNYYVTIERLLILKEKIDRLKSIQDSIDNNAEYKRLLSSLFVGYKSDIEAINKLLFDFELYSSIFTECKYVEYSFEKEKDLAINVKHIDNLCDSIIDSIKNYSRYFKEGTDKFYYDELSKVYESIDNLIANREELVVYMDLMKALDDLDFYGLNKLSEYIVDTNEKEIKYVPTFLKQYYKNLLTIFENNNQYILDANHYYQLLEDIMIKEDQLIESNCNEIATAGKKKYNISKLKNMNYNDYINRTAGIKYLFLTTSNELNYFIDINTFDLVLIDDAQILDSNEYIKATMCNQVIVAGTPLVSFGITEDLLSIMKRTNTIKLKYRYLDTPMLLLNNISNLKAKMPSEYINNIGINYSKLSIDKLIKEILEEEKYDFKNIKMNIFAEEEVFINELYDIIANILLEYAEVNEVYEFIKYNLNICGLSRHYTIDADYNLLLLKDYKDVNDNYEVVNFMNSLCCVKKQLVICDDENILEMYPEETADEFIKAIHRLVNSNITFKDNYQDDAVHELIKKLKSSDIIVEGSIGNYALVLKKNNLLYGIIIFDLECLHESNVLNLYRNKYYGACIDTACIFLHDLENNFDDCIERIIKMISGGQDE